MNQKLKIIMRLSRNILIALISAVWVWPFWVSAEFLFRYMQWLEERFVDPSSIMDEYPFWISISPFTISSLYLRVAGIWLMVVIFFWAFVAANKLWPIKGKPKQ